MKLKCVSDYLLIRPDKPKGGSFDAGATYIDEVGTIEDTGPLVTEEAQKLKGKKVIFMAAFCEQKTINGERYYFAPESSNCICAVI